MGTTGLATIDYILADRFLIPEDKEEHYTEKILRLPNGFAVCDQPADAPDVGALPALSKGYVTFSSFNHPMKISPKVVETWAEILKELPASKLVLKYLSFSDAETRRRFIDLFE